MLYCRIIGCVALASIRLTCVEAAQWELKGSLKQQAIYDDNIALRPIKQAVAGYLLTPNLQASYKTGVLEMDFNGGGEIRRYDDSNWNCENYNLGFNNRYLTRRSRFALSGGYNQSCSYSQQIQDTGILMPSSQSENYKLAPSWIWQQTPRDQLTAEAAYSQTNYSNSGPVSSNGIGYSDNETYSAHLTMSHLWDRRIALNAGLSFTNTQYTGRNASTQNIFGFQLGGKYAINQKWAADVSGGVLVADIRQDATPTLAAHNTSPILGIANISISYKDPLSHFTTGYSSSISPSAIGQTLQTQALFATYTYQLGHHISLNFDSNLSHSKPIRGQPADNLAASFNRNYATASATVAWDFERNWQLKGGYIYRWQEYKQQATTSDSNMVMLSLTYTWDGIRDLPYLH